MDIGQWLESLGLGEYAPAFAENRIGADLLPDLTDQDLRDLGITALGDRKRLLAAIASLERGNGATGSACEPATGPSSEGERRQVTVLFADIAGFTSLSGRIGAEATHEILNRYFEAADRIIEDFGGSVDKHIGDNVMGVFGAPVAHDNDPERAVRAALAIQEAVRAIEAPGEGALRLHIGIAAGQVVAMVPAGDHMMPASKPPEPQPDTHTGSLRILGRANSFNVRKVLWLCDEIGVPYTREDYGRGYRSTDTPEFLRLNPTGQVPVVIDGDLVLRESNTILRYLAAKHGPDALYPSDLAERARIEQWMDWVAYDVTHALRGAFLGGQLQEAPWNHAWFVAQGRKDLTELMRLLNANLAEDGPHVVGESFTIADIPVGLVVNRWFMLESIDRPDLPALTAYYDLLGERPAYRKHGRNGLP